MKVLHKECVISRLVSYASPSALALMDRRKAKTVLLFRKGKSLSQGYAWYCKKDWSTKSFIKWAWLFYSLCTINISFIYFSFFLPLCATCHIGKRNSKDSIAIVVALIFFFIQVFFYVEYKEKNICAYLILWNVIYYMWYILFKFYILM